MKIRKSFVSNSSSCSFVIFGITDDDLKQKYGKCFPEEGYFDNIICGQDGVTSYFGNTLTEHSCGYITIGILDNETKIDFENRTRKLIRMVFGENICDEDIQYYSEAYYNG